MERRDFLKILGAGVTIPLVAPAVAGAAPSVAEKNPWAKNSSEKFIRGFYSKNEIEIVGGYDDFKEYYWMRVAVRYNGRTWHDLVRRSGDQPLNYEAMAKIENAVLERSNIPARITEQMIAAAFGGANV